MKKIILTTVLILASAVVVGQSVFWDTNKKWGVKGADGKIIVPGKYDYIGEFYDGLAVVNIGGEWEDYFFYEDFDGGKWGYIDKTGKEVIPLIYDDAEDFIGGIAIVWKGGNSVFIDKTGKEIVRTNETFETNTTLGCVSGNCTNGWGKKKYTNGYYEGFWTNGYRDGFGVYVWKNEGNYTGFFKEDKLSGYGVYQNEIGKMVQGMYANGKANGLGEQLDNNIWTQGYYIDHVLKTPYEFEYSIHNTRAANGCLKGDCMNGYGQYKWEKGDYYSGFFLNGKLHLGTYVFANGDKYKGLFGTNGLFHGQGIFFYQGGDYYGGEFQNGKFHGKGCYIRQTGQQEAGEWQFGELIKAY